MVEIKPGDIERMNVKLELGDKINEEIVRTFVQAENERKLKEFYEPLAEKYPVVNALIIDHLHAEVLNSIDCTETQLTQVKVLRPMLEAMASSLERPDKEANELKELLDKIDSIDGLFRQYAAMTEKYYVGITRAAREIALAKNMEPVELVKSQEYRDEAERKIFPIKQESEKFLDLGEKTATEMLTILYEFKEVVKKSEFASVCSAALENMEKLIPSKEALDGIRQAMREYNRKELDRIYSK